MGGTWSEPTTHEAVCRRASGRRHYNAWRSFRACERRMHVARLLRQYTQEGAPRHGAQARVARELGVHRSTVTRDVQALERDLREVEASGKLYKIKHDVARRRRQQEEAGIEPWP